MFSPSRAYRKCCPRIEDCAPRHRHHSRHDGLANASDRVGVAVARSSHRFRLDLLRFRSRSPIGNERPVCAVLRVTSGVLEHTFSGPVSHSELEDAAIAHALLERSRVPFAIQVASSRRPFRVLVAARPTSVAWLHNIFKILQFSNPANSGSMPSIAPSVRPRRPHLISNSPIVLEASMPCSAKPRDRLLWESWSWPRRIERYARPDIGLRRR